MKPPRRPIVIRPASQLNSEINVTPLVDVVLVLLIIFMVVTPLLYKNLRVRVANTEQVNRPEELPPEQLLVRVSASGEIRLQEDPVGLEQCVERLRQRLELRVPADRVVFVAPEDDAAYERVIAVIDGARRAGAQTIGMSTDDPVVDVRPGAVP